MMKKKSKSASERIFERAYSKRMREQYQKALIKYPDLKHLSVKLVVLAYKFREELLREYASEHTSELANARCNIKMGGCGYSQKLEIPEDLPGFSFDRECIVCFRKRKGLFICPDCWQLLRLALEIKGEKTRYGWEGWGVEMNLDLSNVVRLLRENPESEKLLIQNIEQREIW